jgi:hypothetical protein
MTTQTPEMAFDADTETAAGALRCSDAERERTSSALRVAAGEGRLTLDEVDERHARIYSARFRHELDVLTADLPTSAAAETGWHPVITMARRQFAVDLSALIHRGRTEVSQRRRLALALAALVLLLCAVAMVVLALHGITGDGSEHAGVGRD